MKKYIAELTESGLYNLVVVKHEVGSTTYMLDNKLVADRVIIDENGETRAFSPRTMKYVEFKNLEDCQEFISYMNRF